MKQTSRYPGQTNSHLKHTHLQQTHHNIFYWYDSVNAIWRELSSDSYHGDTQYHIATPSIWFQQNTSLNSISIAIAKHLTNIRNRLTNKEIDNDIHGTPYPFTKAKFHNFQRMAWSLASYNQYFSKPGDTVSFEN